MWASVGVRREAKLWFSIEVALLLSIFSTIIIGDSFSVQRLIRFEVESYPIILLNPIAAVTFLLAILEKLRLKPSDIPDSEVEVVGSPFSEYPGKLLGLLYLSKYFVSVALIVLFVDLFLSGGVLVPPVNIFNDLINFSSFVILMMGIVFVLSILHSLMPKFRMDQAYRWTIKVLLPLSIISLTTLSISY